MVMGLRERDREKQQAVPHVYQQGRIKGLAGEDHLRGRKGSWESEKGTRRNSELCRTFMKRPRRQGLPGGGNFSQ